MIVFGILLVLAAGSCNIYPLYMNHMMDKFGFTLKEANLFGSFINLGLWMAFTMGLVYDKFGPKISCIIGAILLSGSYAILHMIMNSDLKTISLAPLLLLAIVMGQGSALCYTTAVTTNLKNFSSNNSSIVGLLISNMAISPSIFTTYRQALSNVRIANYFLMISVFLGVVILLCGWFFTNLKNIYSSHEKLKDYEKYKEKKIIRLFVILNIMILVIYTFGVIFNNVLSEENKFPNAIIYPCLQLLNFLFIIFEMTGLWEKLYFREFIEKELRRRLNLEIKNYNKETFEKEEKIHELDEINKENNIEKVEAVEINFNHNNNPPLALVDEKSLDDISTNKNKVDNIEKPVSVSGLVSGSVLNQSRISKNRKNSFNGDTKVNYSSIKFDFNLEQDAQIQDKNLSYKDDNKSNKIRSLFENENPFENNQESPYTQGMHDSHLFNQNPAVEIKLEARQGSIEEDNPINININNIEKINTSGGTPNEDPHLENQSEFSKFYILISTKEILILFTILILGIGSVIANLNNVQFIISSVSLAPTSKEIFDYAVMYFVFNSFFRIISGLIIDRLIEKNMFYHFLISISVIGFISQLLGVSMDKDLLFISVALAGATHGGYMTFTPIYSKQFGLQNMGKVLGFLTTGCAIGSILISDVIFTVFFDENKVDEKCVGKKCFSDAYIITSLFFAVNIVLSVVLYRMNRLKKI
jgi:MFS family permease